jgi:hypothetical protein
MKTLMVAIVVCLLLGSTAYGGWYVAPARTYAYYPMVPAYAYPAPVYAYPAPVVAPVPYSVYSPVVVPAPVWVGPPGVVVRSKVFIPGRPIRNTVRAVLP